MKKTSTSLSIVSSCLISILFFCDARSAAAGSAARCQLLEHADFSTIAEAPSQILSAQIVEPKGAQPGYCKVLGYVSPQVGFELHLPTAAWNGKFLQKGCGGNCGVLVPTQCDEPLRKGYACIVSDMGHKGTALDSLWAYENLQAEVDYGYRAAHVVAIAGKAIASSYYGRAPRRSYFMGCSQGGRQGMVEAQRFPWDFDGIIAGAPPVSITHHWIRLFWRKGLNRDARGNPILSAADFELIHRRVLASCDADDGIEDGIVSNPPACHFAPETLACGAHNTRACLSATQIETVKRFYAGLTSAEGDKIVAGEVAGTELNWKQYPLRHNRSEEKFRYMTFSPDLGPRWQPREFDFERDYRRTGMMEALYGNNNPDLRKFKAAGGKLIVYHGWTDTGPSPVEIVDYYETVERTMGGSAATQDFFRLFMVPGMNHCNGGDGAWAIDYLRYLEAWVEEGTPPDVMLGAHVKLPPDAEQAAARIRSLKFPLDNAEIVFTRPIYPYPTRAKYRGHGDPNEAASFVPVQP